MPFIAGKLRLMALRCREASQRIEFGHRLIHEAQRTLDQWADVLQTAALECDR